VKKILITGANSYIGTSFEKWAGQWPGGYSVDTADMTDGAWRSRPFGGYDTIFHVAGIVHKKERKKNAQLYYKVNRDLTFEVAKTAKDAGVRQFIFLSSMSVYGLESGYISIDARPAPKSNYGKSKLEGEQLLRQLNDEEFKVVILRPPMVYGRGCRGNYTLLSKIAKKTPFFPDIDNRRSMLYIDNLCEFIRLMVENGEAGTFYPQNDAYVKTAEMVKLIAQARGREIALVHFMNWAVKLLGRMPGKPGALVNKVFGSLVYDKKMSAYSEKYEVCDFISSVRMTEGTEPA